MAKGREIKLPLPAADDLFSTQEERDEAKREFIADIPLTEISDFVVVKHFCNTLFENSPGISSFKWCFPIIVGMRTDMIVPYVHISV